MKTGRWRGIVVALALASGASAQEWRPDYSLRPRSDGPGLASLTEPPPRETKLADGPASPEQQASWLAGLSAWREARKREIGYRDDLYRRPDLAWTRRVFTQAQLLVWDRDLYDPATRTYTADRALAGIEARFGPLDAVLIWPGYPNLGLDERNQFDLMRDLPGGMAELKRLVDSFHSHGAKVFFPVVVWDLGTRESERSRAAEADAILREIGADGINLDTLDSTPDEARTLSLKKPAIALEPQFDPQNDSLMTSPISWNDWVLWDDEIYPLIPRVSRVKWLEPRHMTVLTDRYARFKINSLQQAFFNGQGYAVLENLWGFWDGFSPRDAEAVKRFARIERAYADLLASPDWEPHAPTLSAGLFASRFPGTGQTLWTLINRNDYAAEGEQLNLPAQPGLRYYDLWQGRELTPRLEKDRAILSFTVEPLGFGAILVTQGEAPAGLLAAMAEDAAKPLDSFSRATPFLLQTMTPMEPTANTLPAEEMVAIPAAEYDFRVGGIEIENGDDPGVDVQFPWESSPRRFHRRRMHIDAFQIDRTPVTNAQFKRFLAASHYRPADEHNFLKDWQKGSYPAGWDDKPVTWVSLEDVRAYAVWAGKRLPHVWEWQYAAQGTDERIYPWGNEWDAGAVPPVETGRVRRPPSGVHDFPRGASPFGLLDMEGNVAQWTDEFADGHTRAAILRGGDYYRPQGSMWYFPKSDRLDEQEKYLLMAPSRDRSGVVGFRCVRDEVPGQPGER